MTSCLRSTIASPATRPTKFDDAIAAKFVLLLKAGNATPQAAQVAGISERAYYRWMHLGERPGRRHTAYRQFREAVLRARAEFEAQMAPSSALRRTQMRVQRCSYSNDVNRRIGVVLPGSR